MAYLFHIEPSASLRAMVSRLALGAGWEYAFSTDFPEAVGEIRARVPDLIVTAATFPSANLAELVVTLRADPELAVVPIILFTGSKRRDKAASALELGVAEVFFKEEPQALLRYLEDVALTEAELVLLLDKVLGDTSRPPPGVPARPGSPAPSASSALSDSAELTDRERSICGMAVKGIPDKEIARQQGISYWTVRTYMGRIFRKLGVANRVELAGRFLGSEAEPSAEKLPEPCPDWMTLSAHVVYNLRHGVVIADSAQRILWVNPAFTQITGFATEEAVGQTPRILKSGKQDADFYRSMFAQLAEEGHWTGEVWNRHKEGRLFLEWLDIRALPPGAPRDASYVAVISDITERRIETERIRHSALHDALTGLANRILLRDRADQEIARARRDKKSLAVAFIDLDRFKPINDTLGHDAGDEVLKEVAARLRTHFRTDDTLARYGGDEFVAILPGIGTRDNALLVAAKILHAFAPPFRLNGNGYRLGASVGVSLYPEDGSSFDELIVCSDLAMYRAKEEGGSCIRSFEENMSALAEHALSIENRLHRALERDEFVLHFQPKVDLATRRIVGAEALVRWLDPERGLIPPAEFIPAAERSGLILPIGSWILREACRALARIHDAGVGHFSMAINISPLQISGSDFGAEVDGVLAETGVAASRIQLEITESTFVRDPERATGALNRLVETGVSLALDDFGTGYSSLGYLKLLPIDTIKVDRCFIDNVDTDRYNAAIARATVQLAEGLDMNVVAEGVENERQLAFLQSIGCPVAQGFLFSPPVAESALLSALLDDAARPRLEPRRTVE